jgi:hypothetical protein
VARFAGVALRAGDGISTTAVTHALRQLDPEHGLIPEYAGEEFLTTARHMLGEQREERPGARKPRMHPRICAFSEGRWRPAARVRAAEVERLLQERCQWRSKMSRPGVRGRAAFSRRNQLDAGGQ